MAGPASAAQSAAEPGGPDGTEIRLPLTIAKVWFRGESEKKPGKLKKNKRSGDLTLTEAGFEFISKKDSFFLPVDRLSMISYGTLGQGVDTEWIVVGLREGETTHVVAFRDGRKLGYGQQTDEIHRKIRGAAELLGAAQFSAPEGFESYTAFDDQLTVVIRDSWNAYVLTSVFVGGSAPWGRTVFSPESVDDLKDDVDDPHLRRMYDGDLPAILVERSEADAGMTCAGLSRKAVGRLLDQADEGPIFAAGAAVVEEPTATPVVIAGCRGVRIEARTKDADGVERVLDQRFFANEGTLFRFAIRSRVENLDEYRGYLDEMLETLRLPLAYHNARGSGNAIRVNR
jgi:hypothetical protein